MAPPPYVAAGGALRFSVELGRADTYEARVARRAEGGAGERRAHRSPAVGQYDVGQYDVATRALAALRQGPGRTIPPFSTVVG